MKDFCVYLDAGHGGLDPITGNYHCLLQGKMYKHTKGEFHNGPLFYEGVFNRQITSRVSLRLKELKITHMIISHSYIDIELSDRVSRANWYHQNFMPGILISNHANASPLHNASGYEVYSSPGETKADQLAQLHWNNVEALLKGKIRMRPDLFDGDHDKEANFYMLRKTIMPAILVEHLFFDHYSDAVKLMDEQIIDKFAEAEVRAIIQYIEKN